MIDTTAEYRLFSEDGQGDKGNPIRVGFPYDFSKSDGGLDLKVEGGKKCPIFERNHNKLKSSSTRESASDYKGSVLIGKWADHLYLPDKIVNKTKILFQTLKKEKKSFKGLSVNGIAASLLWLACKQEESQNASISFTKLAEVSGVEEVEIKKCYSAITGDLPAELRAPAKESASSYGGRFARELNLSDEACALIDILERNIKEKGFLEGKNPRTIGAISVHTVCLLSTNESDIRSLKEIVGVAELSEATVKKSYKQYLQDIVKVVPEREGMKKASTLVN